MSKPISLIKPLCSAPKTLPAPKILDETIRELKETDFKDLYQTEEKTEVLASKDCIIETDLELLLPDTYVNNVAERLSLYKQLNAQETDAELATFRLQLEDRFGKIPPQTEELLETVKMRRLAKQIGLEKAVLKRQKFVGTFITDPHSTFYQSPTFERVLEFVKNHPKGCEFKEINEKLTISFPNIRRVSEICAILGQIIG